MKKQISLLFFLFIITIALPAQTQHGIVKTRGRMSPKGELIPGKRLPGVTINVNNTFSFISGNNGSFSFVIPAESFSLTNVRKQGYQLCDQDMLNKRYLYSPDPIVIAMETDENVISDRLVAERNIRRTLQLQLNAKENEIESLKEQNKITEEQYHTLLQNLYYAESKNESLISDMAIRYSAIDFDELDEFQMEVAFLIQNGQLASADSLLNTKGSMEQRSAELDRMDAAIKANYTMLAGLQREYNRRKELKERALEDFATDCYSHYEICKMRHQNDSAALWLELRASKDTLNADWQIDCGFFVLNYLADYEKAQKYMQKAVDLIKSNAEYSDAMRGASLSSLADVYLKSGEYDNAIRIYTDSRNMLSESTVQYITSTIGLANCFESIGRRNEALNLNFEAYEMYKNSKCDRPALLCRIYHQLGSSLYLNGKVEDGIEYINRALNLVEDKGPAEQPRLITIYHDLASIYQEQNYFDKAEELYEKAIQVCLQIYDEDHPMLASLYSGQGVLYYRQSKLQEALSYSLKAREIYRNKVHNDSYAHACFNVADILMTAGNINEAEQYVNEAVDVMQRLYGENSTFMIETYSMLGSLYFEKEDYEKALAYYEKSVDLIINSRGDKDPLLIENYSFIGGVYMREGKGEEALKWFLRIVDLTKQFYGDKHSKTADALVNVAGVYLSIGKYEEALHLLENARAIHISTYGDMHIDVAGDYNGLGQTYMAMGRYQDAIANFEKAIEIRKAIFGPNSIKLKSLYTFMEQIYRKLGDVDNAATYENLLKEIR